MPAAFEVPAIPSPAEVSVTGVSGIAGSSLERVSPRLTDSTGNPASGTPHGGAPRAAGTYTVMASYAGSGDYKAAAATTTFAITRATPTVQVSDAGGVYTGAIPTRPPRL